MSNARNTLALLTVFFIAAAPALAQPSAQQIVDRAQQAYVSMMSGVDSYLVSMDMFGMDHQMYYERVEGGQGLDFRAYVRVPGQSGWVSGEDEAPGGVSVPTEEMLQRLRSEARFAGEHTVDGRRVYALEVSDPSTLMNPEQLPGDDDMEFDSLQLFVDRDSYMMIGFDASGTVRADGREAPVTMRMRASDFRTVGGMTHPFMTTMHIEGVAASLSDDERRQLEEARRQMEQMPPAQREMMERMMGEQLRQFEQMADGEPLEMEMRVTDLQVNVPRPD